MTLKFEHSWNNYSLQGLVCLDHFLEIIHWSFFIFSGNVVLTLNVCLAQLIFFWLIDHGPHMTLKVEHFSENYSIQELVCRDIFSECFDWSFFIFSWNIFYALNLCLAGLIFFWLIDHWPHLTLKFEHFPENYAILGLVFPDLFTESIHGSFFIFSWNCNVPVVW